jgi:hypothetical protein
LVTLLANPTKFLSLLVHPAKFLFGCVHPPIARTGLLAHLAKFPFAYVPSLAALVGLLLRPTFLVVLVGPLARHPPKFRSLLVHPTKFLSGCVHPPIARTGLLEHLAKFPFAYVPSQAALVALLLRPTALVSLVKALARHSAKFLSSLVHPTKFLFVCVHTPIARAGLLEHLTKFPFAYVLPLAALVGPLLHPTTLVALV